MLLLANALCGFLLLLLPLLLLLAMALCLQSCTITRTRTNVQFSSRFVTAWIKAAQLNTAAFKPVEYDVIVLGWKPYQMRAAEATAAAAAVGAAAAAAAAAAAPGEEAEEQQQQEQQEQPMVLLEEGEAPVVADAGSGGSEADTAELAEGRWVEAYRFHGRMNRVSPCKVDSTAGSTCSSSSVR